MPCSPYPGRLFNRVRGEGHENGMQSSLCGPSWDIPPSPRLSPNTGNCPLFEPVGRPDSVQQRYAQAKAVLSTQLAVLQAARAALLTVSLPASATLQLLASLPPGVAL